jgi:acetylornithine deacetylase/succinyl-diaminopimelate desuccinylase-like protein
MLLAHTDTVFPLSTPLKIERTGDILRGPGIGDNSVSVASMLSVLVMLDELGYETAADIVAVANVGEEGLGNLLGARTAVERYSHELGAVLVIDGALGRITNVAVGSKRWKVTVRGPGGHSYGAFGRPSAIHGLGRIIAAIAELEVPSEPKTTYNVGLIEGGTSVNTIAASASAILDLRSVDVAALNMLAEQVKTLIETTAGEGLRTEIEVLGERPAGRRSESDPLVQLAARTLTWLGREPKYGASSTDANIPISLDIPSVCIGITRTDQAHTVEEHLYISPISAGLAQVLRLCIEASSLVAAQE